jgi:hypothetical protein
MSDFVGLPGDAGQFFFIFRSHLLPFLIKKGDIFDCEWKITIQ